MLACSKACAVDLPIVSPCIVSDILADCGSWVWQTHNICIHTATSSISTWVLWCLQYMLSSSLSQDAADCVPHLGPAGLWSSLQQHRLRSYVALNLWPVSVMAVSCAAVLSVALHVSCITYCPAVLFPSPTCCRPPSWQGFFRELDMQ